LPHAYEGAGPEHSSARPERFLQLAANNNIQVVYPTTPAQMFHLLRRQALRPIKKPLIVLTPKSLLRHPSCLSSLHDFTAEEFFLEFIDDPVALPNCKRLLLCSGKIYYDLLSIREQIPDAAIIRIEQIYPFHVEKFKKIVSKYKDVQMCCYVQEEPENMGAWEFLRPFLASLLPKEIPLRYIGRSRSASTATGSRKKHMQEQSDILTRVKGLQ
jgi:2-oxoglutarate dehydrogenase E1 component